MKRGITVNKSVLFLILGILSAFVLILSAVVMNSLREINKEYRGNLQFRSTLFKDSIRSSITMGDYADALEKARNFFAQSDIAKVEIRLLDGEKLVELHRQFNQKSFVETIDEITIEDESLHSLSDHTIAHVSVIYDLSNLKGIVANFVRQIVILSAFVLVLVLVSVIYFSRFFNLPLKNLYATVVSGDLSKISELHPVSRIKEIFALENALKVMGKQIIEMNDKEKENLKNAAVGRIIAHLSHDLRAPLGIFERILAVPDEQMPSMKNALRDSLNRLYSMIEALRYSEAESLIRKSRSTLSFQFGAENILGKARSGEVNLEVPSQVFGDVTIDAMKVERSWINLASNAMEFTKTFVRVEAELSGSDLLIRVLDDGPGVPAEFLPKLFQRGATYGKHDGTGLGLAYVRQIMRGHGGDVTYRRENELTIFECRLPNAVEPERGQALENAVNLEIQPVQKLVRKVAICLDPETLSEAVLAKLASYKSDEFFFSKERRGANVVVSNVDDIMFEVLESDDQEFISVASLKGEESRIVDLLKHKFNLV